MQFDRDLSSPHKALFLAVREQLLAIDGIEEFKKDKITTYSFNGSSLCHMRTMPHGIDMGFLKGAMVEDNFGLLHGETKRMRVLSLESYLPEELDYYLDLALKLNGSS